MTANNLIAERLSALAGLEFDGIKAWTDTLTFPQHLLLLIEVCRVMDFQHVVQTFSKNPDHKLPIPDFDIMVRGWNPALGLLLPHVGGVNGVPLAESTSQSRNHATTFLHQLGRFSILKQSADMIRHGMLEGEFVDSRIVLRTSTRLSIDHFLDRLDAATLTELRDKATGFGPIQHPKVQTEIADINVRMERLVFPWKTARGTMIGYDAEPDIDRYFLDCVTQNTVDWRDEAGIHPSARLGNVSGSEFAEMGLLLTSFCLKHIRFVDIGKRKVPDANYHMSLTIWKAKSEMVDSLAEFTGMEPGTVISLIDLFTVSRVHAGHFQTNLTPFIPMLIEISEGHLLRPVSSIFRNPFQGIRTFQEQLSSLTEVSIRQPRESWMIADLCRLFMGNKYVIVDRTVRLKRGGDTVTDIDAAVFDRTTGAIALFQLKWQDFTSEEIKKQRSKAKNFVDQIDDWVERVQEWINEFGTDGLCSALRLDKAAWAHVSDVKLFAVGRSAARFQSYGYVSKFSNLAVCSWAQFLRIRYEVGPATNVFHSIHDKIQLESSRPVNRKPMPHKIVAAGQELIFQDLWNDYDETREP